jgi:hypothetical protein
VASPELLSCNLQPGLEVVERLRLETEVIGMALGFFERVDHEIGVELLLAIVSPWLILIVDDDLRFEQFVSERLDSSSGYVEAGVAILVRHVLNEVSEELGFRFKLVLGKLKTCLHRLVSFKSVYQVLAVLTE